MFCASAWTVDSVGPPAGTISHATRGEPSFEQKSSSDEEAIAPSDAIPFTASALKSVTTTSWPPRMRRRAMLAPILPSPTIPRRMLPPCIYYDIPLWHYLCVALCSLWFVSGRSKSALHAQLSPNSQVRRRHLYQDVLAAHVVHDPLTPGNRHGLERL